MGVPKFFRWLSERYPLINQKIFEKSEFDCFYLDMNGIIHTCFQKIASEQNFNKDILFQKIFDYTEYLYTIIHPKKLLYLAIDGVAPRAKMNQQRSRRFRAIKDNEKKSDFDHRNRLNLTLDSNCITPGTSFMAELSYAFKIWLEKKIKTDIEWQTGCDIIFSGAEVPGEGEHKIMNFIRKLKNLKNNPDLILSHCLYGLDADLIMLGLVSHEKNFTLLREKLAWKGTSNVKEGYNYEFEKSPSDDFHLLEISLLREMLYLEFRPREFLDQDYNMERIVDDFVFMCMLIGNDFLPGIPHLDIGYGGLNLLVRSYKEIQKHIHGYLTNKSKIHVGRAELFFEKLSVESEELYFLNKGNDIENNLCSNDYKMEYYVKKLNCSVSNNKERINDLIQTYIEGLHWCLYYYHKGCPSWNWFYPEYYAPLASDLKSLKKIKIKFKKGKPFEPLVQLLAVLPPNSRNLLPISFSRLMVKKDSPVIDYYPLEYKIDMNGKKKFMGGSCNSSIY